MELYTQEYSERFRGIRQLYGAAALDRFSRSRCVVVGIGGVGSWIAEGLARSGLGRLVLWDLDDICINNTNRQIHTTERTVGMLKTRAMAARIQEFHPQCEVHCIHDFYTAETQHLLPPLLETTDGGARPESIVVVDAIDSVQHKARLLKQCLDLGVPVVTLGAAGGRCDPSFVRSSSLAQSHSDPLLRNVRKALRRDFGVPEGLQRTIHAIFSIEDVMRPPVEVAVCEDAFGLVTGPESGLVTGQGSRQSPGRLDCATGYGTAVHVTSVMGFFACGRALDILKAVPVESQQ